MYYIQSKIIKRMDQFKVRGRPSDAPKNILLPLSGGVSSLTLLHVLDQQLHIQMERSNRTGYKLYVLIIDQSTTGGQPIESHYIDQIRERYPSNTYSNALIEDVFNYDVTLDETWQNLLGSATAIGLKSNAELLKNFMSLLPSATSRTDMVNMLRTRLIVEFAKTNSCKYVVWGDSTTRLAEKTLAETAKGRGHSLPWQTADGSSPQDIIFNFPMRDLLRKEIIVYSTMTSPSLATLTFEQQVSPPSMSSKNSTIDSIMSQYFETVEENYPSIVANVVRTSTKLQADDPVGLRCVCAICALPVRLDAQGLHGWGGNQADSSEGLISAKSNFKQNITLCYGCARATIG